MNPQLNTNPQQESYSLLVNHPIQSWAWGEFRKKMAAQVDRFIIDRKAGQVFFYQLPLFPFTIGHCPKINFINQPLINHLSFLGQKRRALFIKIEPNLLASPEAEKELANLGLRQGKEIFSRYTMIINLGQTTDQFLAGFASKTRYNIRLAQKKGVKIIEDNSDRAFNTYWRLTEKTTARQRFYAHDKEYHEKMWQSMKQAGIAHLLLAEYKGETLAAWILFKFKDTLYYPYGASSRRHRQVMASNLLMWEAILFGQRNGCRQFDLWGTPGPNPKKTNPWYGFHRFKAGYNPKIVRLVGAHDLVIKPNLYFSYQTLDNIRRQYLKLKTKL
jgi:lipid II:glycine glycyltransferase (peptidoglycan interpeptide bridge formation enzyme)